MVRKSKKAEGLSLNPNEKFLEVETGDHISKSMLRYGEEVNVNRALPRLEDGLKPAQRYSLFVAHENKFGPTSPYVKMTRVVGDAMAKYYVHGDGSLGETIYNMMRDWNLNVIMFDSEGNKGSQAGDPPAAPRYLEVRMSVGGQYITKGLDKDTVDFVPNYDGSLKEPVVMPSPIPNALINPSKGIGYGMATTIIPHNPIELLNGAIKLIQNPKTTDKALAKIIPGPDFPTGGTIIGEDEILNEISKGKASYLVRGSIEHEPEEQRLIIHEVPYGASVPRIMEQLTSLFIDNQLGVDYDQIDNNSRKGIEIVIRYNKGANVEQIKELIFQKTEMESRISCTNNMIYKNRPVLVGIKDYLEKWTEFRGTVLTRELNFDLNKTNNRLNLVIGLLHLYEISDEVVKAARASKNRADLVQTLQTKKFGFNEEQSEYIAGMAIYRLGKTNEVELQSEKNDLEKEVERITSLLNDENAFTKYLIKDMKSSIKFLNDSPKIDVERKTKIVAEVERVEVDLRKLEEKNIEAEETNVIIRKDGIVMRNTNRVFNNNIEEAKANKPIIQTMQAMTTDWAMFFTSDGGVITRRVLDLDNNNPKYDIDSLHKQVNDFKFDHELIGGAIFNEKVEKENLGILSLTEQGYAKISPLASSMPNTNTRRYLSRMTPFNGLKKRNDGDSIGIVTLVKLSDIEKKKLVITMKDGEFSMPLKNFSQQNAGGSGAKRINGYDSKNLVKFEIK